MQSLPVPRLFGGCTDRLISQWFVDLRTWVCTYITGDLILVWIYTVVSKEPSGSTVLGILVYFPSPNFTVHLSQLWKFCEIQKWEKSLRKYMHYALIELLWTGDLLTSVKLFPFGWGHVCWWDTLAQLYLRVKGFENKGIVGSKIVLRVRWINKGKLG